MATVITFPGHETPSGHLLREIARVTAIRESLRGRPRADFQPSLWLMDAALDGARRAASSQDVSWKVRAIRSLQEFRR